MSNAGQAILTIGGTIIGAYFGAPQLGYALGSLAGSALFPTELPTLQGPRLSDVGTTRSNVGAPIPRGWGTFAVAGDIIAKSNIREVITTEETSAKGGPTQSTENATYYQDFAIALCEGPIAGVRRIWANGKPIYDRRPQQDGESTSEFEQRMAASDIIDQIMTIYVGTEDQEPDPTLETIYGVGEISGFRGLAYLVFANWQNKPEDGMKMPMAWKVECYTDGQISVDPNGEYSNEVLYPWLDAANPVNPANDHIITAWYPNAGNSFDSVEEALQVQAGKVGKQPNTYMGYTIFATAQSSEKRGHLVTMDFPSETVVEYDAVTVGLNWNQQNTTINHRQGGADGSISGFDEYTSDLFFAGMVDDNWVHSNSYYSGNAYGACYLGWSSSLSPAQGVAQYNANGYIGTNSPLVGYVILDKDFRVHVQRVPKAPPDPCQRTDARSLIREFVTGYCITADGRLIKSGGWAKVNTAPSQQARVLQRYGTVQVVPEGLSVYSRISIVTKYPLNPVTPVGHVNFSNQQFWEDAYDTAVIRGQMEPGLVYGVDYPVTQNFYYARTTNNTTIDTFEVSLALIVSDLLEEAGYVEDDYDVTDLEEVSVIGYIRTRTMAARAAIEPLRSIGFFDIAESAGKLKCIRRGKSVVRTFTANDLGARLTGSDDDESRLVTTKRMDFDLPRQVRIHYMSFTRDYEPGEQSSPVKVDTDAVNELDMDLVAVLTDENAAQIAQVLWADFWRAKWTHQTAVSQRHHDLEATDNIVLPVDGVNQRMRIISILDKFPSVRRFEMIRDDDGSYLPNAVGTDTPTLTNPLTIVGPVDITMLDIPALSSSDDDAGVYLAARPLIKDGGFRGAWLYRSVDNGSSYQLAAKVASATPMGTVIGPLASGPYTIFDEENTLTVQLYYGELENRTEAEVLTGANAFALGVHGRWMIGQFKTATLVSEEESIYELSGILQGRLGTEHYIGTSEVDDQFVMLSAGTLARLGIDNDQIGATYLYKALTAGESLDAAEGFEFAGAGVALECYSPVHITGEVQEDGTLSLAWIRRDRLSQELRDGIDLPMSEESLLFDVEVYQDDVLLATESNLTVEEAVVELLNSIFELELNVRWISFDGTHYYGLYTSPDLGTSQVRKYTTAGVSAGAAFIGNEGTAMVRSGSNLYAAAFEVFEPSVVVRVDTATMAVQATYDSTATGDAQGLAFDGTDLWISESYTGQIRRLDGTTLAVEATLAIAGGPAQMIYKDGDIWICCRGAEGILSQVSVAGGTETARYSVVDFPVEVFATDDLLFVQGRTQIGVYDLVTVDEVIVHDISMHGRYKQHFAFDGTNVVVVDDVADEVVFFDPTTGEEVTRRPLADSELSGFANGYYFFTNVSNSNLHVTTANSVLAEGVYEVRIYQRSGIVGRGTPGIAEFEVDQEQDEVTPEIDETQPDDDAVVLPLTFNETDGAASPSIAVARSGDGSRITDRGFLGDGYEARLRYTTGLPSYVTSIAGPLYLRATVALQAGARNATRDVIVSVCVNDATANPRLELAVVDDLSVSSLPVVAARTYTGSLQAQRICRRNWRFEFQYPEKTNGGNTIRPQCVCILDTDRVIVAGHFQDVFARAYVVHRRTAEVLGYFDYPSDMPHGGGCQLRDSDGTVWLSSNQIMCNIDIEASISSNDAVELGRIDMSMFTNLTIRWVTIEGVERVIGVDYGTGGSLYIYHFDVSDFVYGAVPVAADRIKRMTAPTHVQGVSYKDGLLYLSRSTSGGLIQVVDIDEWVINGAEGDVYTDYLVGDTMRGPSAMTESTDFDETGRLWQCTEGNASLGDDTAWLCVWSSSLGDIEENSFALYDDQLGSVRIYSNDRLFATRSWTPTAVPGCVSVGGPPQAAAGQTNGFFIGKVRDIVVQSTFTNFDDYDLERIYETSGLVVVHPIVLENAGAEEGDGSGWTAEVGALSVRSSSPDPEEGDFYFYGSGVARVTARQRFNLEDDLELTASQVDTGNLWAIAEWLSAEFALQNDTNSVGFRFLDASQVEISEHMAAALATSPDDTWIPRSYGIEVPVGARYIDVILDIVRIDGVNADGFIDDVSANVYRRT